MKTETEITDEAEQHFGPINPGGLLNVLESYYMHGAADEVDGSVEAFTGHFYRVDRWIVVTDQLGFRDLISHDTTKEAEAAFAALSQRYDEWDGMS